MRLTVLVIIAAGCGYSSRYLPRADGRPRAVWVDDHVEVDPAGAPLLPACMQWLGWASHADRLRLVAGELRVPTTSTAPALDVVVPTAPYWVPRFYGSPIVLPAPGVAPLPVTAPLFLPPPLLHAPGIPISGGDAVGPSIGSGGGGRGAAEILAAIAIVVAPAVAVGLAASPPEDTPENAEAIDQVNAYNDLLRSAGSPCTP